MDRGNLLMGNDIFFACQAVCEFAGTELTTTRICPPFVLEGACSRTFLVPPHGG
jgi:hypothetical protein